MSGWLSAVSSVRHPRRNIRLLSGAPAKTRPYRQSRHCSAHAGGSERLYIRLSQSYTTKSTTSPLPENSRYSSRLSGMYSAISRWHRHGPTHLSYLPIQLLPVEIDNLREGITLMRRIT